MQVFPESRLFLLIDYQDIIAMYIDQLLRYIVGMIFQQRTKLILYVRSLQLQVI